MYLDYHHLSRDPFSVSPDPDFLFLSPSHKEALGSLLFCIENKMGFAVVTGEVGTGKTTILRYYLATCDRQNVTPVYIFNPNLTFQELLRTILSELDGRNIFFSSGLELFQAIQRALLTNAEKDKTVVLIIDEAQNIPIKTLERLRMLSNFETSREKLLQIILIGQPELNEKLKNYRLRQLRQRIAVRAEISPLTDKETREYIEHRLLIAGTKAATLFSPKALEKIIQQAKGAPRTVNILCANSLIACIGYGRKQVNKKIINEVIKDLGWSAPLLISKLQFSFATIVVILLGVATAYAIHFALITPTISIKMEKTSPSTFSSFTTTSPSVEPSLKNMYSFQNFSAFKADLNHKKKEKSKELTPLTPPQEQTSIHISREEYNSYPVMPSIQSHSSARPSDSTTHLYLAASQKAPPPQPVTKVVRRGDYLTKMSIEVYGEATEETLSRLKLANPHIKDPNLIFIGDTIHFPK